MKIVTSECCWFDLEWNLHLEAIAGGAHNRMPKRADSVTGKYLFSLEHCGLQGSFDE
jgi:hypothetical protein